MIENAVKEALQPLRRGMVFAGKETVADEAPVCQVFRSKLIRFYLGKEEFEPHYRGFFKWNGNGPEFTQGGYVTHSEICFENQVA